MRACVLVIEPATGTGTETFTGVSDADGSFIGTFFLFQSAGAPINTLIHGGAFTNGYSDFRGVDVLTDRSASAAGDAYSIFNFKGCAVGQSLGDYSLLNMYVDNFGLGNIDRKCKVAASRLGEFDLQKDVNTVVGDAVLVTILGGDDLDIAFTNVINGTYSTPSKPQGLLALPIPAPNPSGGTATAPGGQNVPWGFATRSGIYGASDLAVANQGNNLSAQLTTTFNCTIDQATGLQNPGVATVSAWGATSFTLATGPSEGIPAVFCGEAIICAAGAITEGTASFDTAINAKAVFFLSTGYAASTSVQSPIGQMAHGWANGLAQHGFWSGEQTNGNVGPGYGARYLSDASVIRLGTPLGSSTVFTSVGSVTDITDGVVTMDWSVTSGNDEQILWFAIGEAIVPPPPPPVPVFRTREVVRRRLRRAPIVWSERGGLQTRVKINLFAVDMQPGVGTSDTPDPLVMIRASKDGGFTWGNERLVSAGRVGEYFNRINAWQWGQGRDWVFEVSCTDPVTWNLVGAYLDAEGGEN